MNRIERSDDCINIITSLKERGVRNIDISRAMKYARGNTIFQILNSAMVPSVERYELLKEFAKKCRSING